MRAVGIAGTLAAMLLLDAVHAQTLEAKRPTIPVTQCGQILNERGGEYVLMPGLSCGCVSGANSIVIAADNIHLNLAGATIISVCNGIGINDGLSNIRIDGGGTVNGGGGLTIGKDRHITVTEVSLYGEDDLGGSESGVQINGATDVAIRNCKVGGLFGISGTVDHSAFRDNTITGRSAGASEGIILTGSGNLIEGNSITQSNGGNFGGGVGIQVTERNRILDNVVSVFSFGVELEGNSNVVRGNVVTGTFRDVEFSSELGIETSTGAKHNSIRRNAVVGNITDMYESNGPPCVNVWRDNTYQTSGGAVACIH